MDRLIKSDMAKFREFIEQRGSESGAWRGDVAPAVRPPGAAHALPVPLPLLRSPEAGFVDRARQHAARRGPAFPDADQPGTQSDAIQAAPDMTQSTDVHRMPDPRRLPARHLSSHSPPHRKSRPVSVRADRPACVLRGLAPAAR